MSLFVTKVYVRLPALAILNRLPKGTTTLAQRGSLAINVGQEIVEAESSNCFFSRIASKFLGRFVPIGDSPFVIDEVDSIEEAVEQLGAK